MIKIEHTDLDTIQNTYSKEIIFEINGRIKLLNELINLLKSPTALFKKDVAGNVNTYNKVHVVLTNNVKLSTKKTTILLKNLNVSRGNINSLKKRISEIQNDIDYLNKNNWINDIITSDAKLLPDLQENALKKLKLPKEDILYKYLFSYDDFFEKHIKQIGSDLDLKVCPYCNRQYITNVIRKNGQRIIGPTYDHFYSQNEYPLLTLSFYNLIPSCYTCNSNLKHTKEFAFDTHLHPYYHEMGNSAVFDFNLTTGNTPIRSKINFTPKIKILAPTASDEYKRLKKTLAKDSGSLDVFKMEEVYETHSDIVEEIHEKFDQNSLHYIRALKPLLNKLKTNEEEFYRFHFGNYFYPKDFNKRPLAKLSRDIYDKMKLIYKNNASYRTKKK